MAASVPPHGATPVRTRALVPVVGLRPTANIGVQRKEAVPGPEAGGSAGGSADQ